MVFLGVLLTSCKLFQYSAIYQFALFCLVYIEQRVDYAAIETNLVEPASCIFSRGFIRNTMSAASSCLSSQTCIATAILVIPFRG